MIYPTATERRDPKAFQAWVDREWAELAQYAFAGFLEHGRGAVQLEIGVYRVFYQTFQGRKLPADLRKALLAYDPERELLLDLQDAAGARRRKARVIWVKPADPVKWPVTVYDRVRKAEKPAVIP